MRSDSRAPLKEKLNKRVILCRPANGTSAFALTAQANPSQNQKSKIFPTHWVTVSNKVLNLTLLSKTICLNEQHNIW